jgi:acetyl-CoA acetyltransferase
LDRTHVDPSAIEDVIFGCVTQAGEQSQHVGRNCVLASKLPQSVPAVTIDRQCGSSQQSIHFPAQAVMSGSQDLVIAGGVESMTRVPMNSAVLEDGTEGVHDRDEGVRPSCSFEGLAKLEPLTKGGVLTAGNSSQTCDGSAVLLVASERALKTHGFKPLARVVNLTVTAGNPVIMLEEPLYATAKALGRAGLKLGDIDLFEVNEAFAPVPMAWLKHLEADPTKLNVNGGAISLGHPLGATGAKLMATLVHALRRRKKKYGLQTMCEGGGVANVTIVEAL